MGQASWVPKATVMGSLSIPQLLAPRIFQAPDPAWVFGNELGFWSCSWDLVL